MNVLFFCPRVLGGAASLFALTTCTAASLREKDDQINWALGGASSGILIGFSSKLLFIIFTIYCVCDKNGKGSHATLHLCSQNQHLSKGLFL